MNGTDVQVRVAIFGGTFDPVHRAHIAVAEAARESFALDRVLLVPAANPPHKRGRMTEDWSDRYQMVQLACADHPGLEASDLEGGQEMSYSVRTIERLRSRLAGQDRLFFLIGADAFAEIGTWYRWEEVAAAVEFIVVTRPGHDYVTPAGATVHRLDTLNMPVSSSRIREMLARCEPPEELPGPVFEYIQNKRLYGFGSACEDAAREHSG